jgi:hypothetical protein
MWSKSMDVQVTGAAIGRQYIGGDRDHFEWMVSYQRNGSGLFHHAVSSRRAPRLDQAMELAKRELGQIEA